MRNKIKDIGISIVVIMFSGLFLVGCYNSPSDQLDNKKLPAPLSQLSSTAKVPFDQLFQVNADGSVSPKMPVSFKGVTMTSAVKFSSGVMFSGIDITKYIGHDIEVNQQNGVSNIIRFY